MEKKRDDEVRHLIRKDVDRTMQELEFFNDETIRDAMCDLLYIWACENPEYLYQQGMNDILAVVMVCLASELTAQTGDIFSQLHCPASFWSEAYWLHARIMVLGA